MRRLITTLVITGLYSGCSASGQSDLRETALSLDRSGNNAEAFELLTSSALAEEADIQFQISQMYVHGDGVQQDDALALAWLIKSIAQGHHQAISYMGNVYRFGLLGFPKDAELAAYWEQYSLRISDRAGRR